METIGEKIYKIRKENKWSLAFIAKKAGVAISTISRIERNELNPRPNKLKKISLALGVSAEYLLGINNENQIYDKLDISTQKGSALYVHRIKTAEKISKIRPEYNDYIELWFKIWLEGSDEAVLFLKNGLKILNKNIDDAKFEREKFYRKLPKG